MDNTTVLHSTHRLEEANWRGERFERRKNIEILSVA
jgi:hypothetical protein